LAVAIVGLTRVRASPNGRSQRSRIVAIAAVCLALAGLTLLVPSAPTTDPWGWIVWGREILHLDLSTVVPGAPAWKPLPVLFTSPLAIAGDAAPSLWLLLVRASGLASLYLAYRVGARLGGQSTGLLAMVALVLSAHWLREFAHGYSEPLAIALLLAAVDQQISGRPRWALLLGALVALGRPEAWFPLALYGIVLARRGEARPLFLAPLLLAVPALWLVPDWIGSGDPFHASKAARAIVPTGVRPTLTALGEAALIVPLPLSVTAVAAAVLGLHRGDRRITAIAAAVLVWTALLALIMLAGYPAESRFFVVPAALLCVLGAFGAVQIVEATGGRFARIAVIAVLALAAAPAVALRAERLVDTTRASVTLARLESDLRTTIELARVPLHRCGDPALPGGLGWVKGLVAWELDISLQRVRDAATSASDYIDRLSDPEDEPPPRLPPGSSVKLRSPGHPFVLLAPFDRAPVRLAGRSRPRLVAVAGAGRWRAWVANSSCRPARAGLTSGEAIG
jgi:hypothetical protein